MGAKTAMLAFADGDVAEVLRRPAFSTDPAAAEGLLRRLMPGWTIEPARDEVLAEANFAPRGIVHVLSVPGLDLVCGLDWLRRFELPDGGAWLPDHVLAEGAGRRTVFHRMHSGDCSVAFALWRDGAPERAVGIAGVDGVVADLGERLDFEAPYWNGDRPHLASVLFADAGPSPFATPFHPISFGDAAVRALFGFAIEGRRLPDDVDADAVRLAGFHVRDPEGPSPDEEPAALQAAARRMVRRSYTLESTPTSPLTPTPTPPTA